MKEEKITGLLKFYDLQEQEGEIRFIAHEEIEQTVNKENFDNDFPLVGAAVLDMLVFELNIYDQFNDQYSNWLALYFRNKSESGRTEFWCETITIDWWQIFTVNGEIYDVTYLGPETIIECFNIGIPGGGFGGDTGDPDPDPDSLGDEEEEEQSCEVAIAEMLSSVGLFAGDLIEQGIDVTICCESDDYEECLANLIGGDNLVLGMDDEILTICEIRLLFTEHKSCVDALKENRTAALTKATEYFGSPGGGVNGCGDAFRHAFFNALNARDCGIETACVWGVAHECNETANDSQMDRFNNEIGYYFGIAGASNDEIALSICEVLSGGILHILLDEANNDSEIINSTGCSCY